VIRHAVAHPVSTATAAAALVALGLFSLPQLPVALLPRLDRPEVRIGVDAPQRSQAQIVERVVEPLEPRLLSIEGVTSLRALVRDGSAALHLVTDWSVDADRLYIEVERRLAELGQDPEVEYAVELQPADRAPILELAVTGARSPAERAAFVADLLVPQLASLQGVSGVDTVGLSPRHVVVRPRAADLAAARLTAADLAERLRPLGLLFPVGEVRRGAAVHDVVVEQRVGSLDQLRRLPLDGLGGPRLSDVASVDLETAATGSFARVDGRDAVLVRVFRAPGANGVAVVEQVRQAIAGLAESQPAVALDIVHDRSAEIVRALELLALAALTGLLAGALILRLILGSWRHAVTLALIIPSAILMSFSVFHLFGVSLNLISLSGLGLAAGLLVDSAVVVLEAIERSRGAGEAEPALAGTRTVAGAVLAGFLTTSVVFLPLLYLSGLARAFFGVQAFAIVVSLLFALLLSLTLTPVLSRVARPAVAPPTPLLGGYLRLLRNALERPAAIAATALLLVAAGTAALLLLPRELMPSGPSAQAQVLYELPAAIDEGRREALGRELLEEVTATAAPFGPLRVVAAQRLSDPLDDPDRPSGEIVFDFAGPEEAKRAVERLRHSRGASAELAVEASLRPTALLEAAQWAGGRYEVLASAETPQAARSLAERLAARLRLDPSIGRVTTPTLREQPMLRLEVAPAGAGIAGEDLRRHVEAGLGELAVGRVDVPGAEPEILLHPTAAARLELLPVRAAETAEPLPLGAWTVVHEERRPVVVERREGRWTSSILVRTPAGAAPAGLDRLLDAVPAEAGESVRLAGEGWELRRSFRQLTLLLVLSLLLVFLTVTALYESMGLAAVVMATVPLGLAGAGFLLALGGQTLNVMSFLGLVLLAGIVVNNSIVLIHRAEQLRRAGAAAAAAVRLAAEERYRPILITTLTTLAGMLPLAVLGGEGVELRRALCLAVIGGLTTSTLASLLLVPSLYVAIRRRHEPAQPPA
jgi:hydrophobic/amphiphilic exporter-1 (mainly G- bacteria), HAE1 family